MTLLGNPDDAILHEVQPLLRAQTIYMDQLESELQAKQGSLNNLRSQVVGLQERHERELDELTAKFKAMYADYRNDSVENKR